MTFDPPFSGWVVLAVTAAAIVLVLIRERRSRRILQPKLLHMVVVGLRVLALALLAFILMNPVERVTNDVPESRSLILVDESDSMSLVNSSGVKRSEEAGQWVDAVRAGLVETGQPEPDLMAFATALHPILGETVDGKETRLAGALESSLGMTNNERPDQILVVSDGRPNDRHDLPTALALAGKWKVPISTYTVGDDTPPRNARVVSVQAPRIVRPRSTVLLQIALATTGIADGKALKVTVKDDAGLLMAEGEASVGGGEAEMQLSFESGLRTGNYILELNSKGEEVSDDDNQFSFSVEVATTKLRVLFVEGTHVKRTVGTSGYALNDMELMTKAWDATGEIEYECLTPISEYVNKPNLVGVTFRNGEMLVDKTKTFPERREDLYRFDVMLISDVPVGNFSPEQLDWVVDWVVERGGGFLMGGGYTTFDVGNYDKTPWERIIPVDMMSYGDGFYERGFKISIPDSVIGHPIWRIVDDPEKNAEILANHPKFWGMNRVRRAKPGALVLATREGSEDEPVFAAQQYGRGRSVAYLPDPNGGWGRAIVKWGPPGGPVQGRHTELGHGKRFRFKSAAANAGVGEPPPHPAPYYGKFWVNMVRWLGENSVRWQRNMLAGRVIAAQAIPGKELPVAVEVLAVSELDALLGLDVGARLDVPGSSRVRLEYDRDRREFVGALSVPGDFAGDKVGVLFDTSVDDQTLTDGVSVGIIRGNREYSEPLPDREFMAELAVASGGKALETADEAVAQIGKVAEERARSATTSFTQPLWAHWPLWAILFGLLGSEWLLRRWGASCATAIATVAVYFGLGGFPV